MQSLALVEKLQRIACEDRLFKLLVSIFGPPENGPMEYRQQVKQLMQTYETKLVGLAQEEAIKILQDLIDEEVCPLAKTVKLFETLSDFMRLDLVRCAEHGALSIVEKERQEEEEMRKQAASNAPPVVSLDDDADVRRHHMKMSAEEKFRIAFLVRAGLADEDELLEATDEAGRDEEVELNEMEPLFLKGLVRQKRINFRGTLPSEQLRNATPAQRNAMLLRRAVRTANAQLDERNTMRRAALVQQQRNIDRKILRARERRREAEQQQQQRQSWRGGGGRRRDDNNNGGDDDDNDATGDATVMKVNGLLEEEIGESKELGGAEERAFSRRLPPWMRRMVGDRPRFGYANTATDAKTLREQRESLPIFAFREQLLQHIDQHPTTVLVGETGSGKTTQIPQYLYEHGYCKTGVIACTQPRRVAAETLARRVAEEFGCSLGAEVGYTVRFKDNTSSLTRIKYMTDGMLLREALLDDTFQRYSVIILDEAHERSINTDVLFGIVKKAVSKRPSLKVVVTSATLDTERFCDYFGAAAPFYIQGRTYPVDTLYLQEPTDDYVETALLTVMMIHLQEAPGDILVFLTGQEEIDNAGERLVHHMEELQRKASASPDVVVPPLLVLPLTATMPEDVQSKVFEATPEGSRKVVLATNVAETSITIGNLFFVVDSGFCKQNMFDPKTGVEQLKIVPVSRAQANQRQGRAGRIGPGKCFRLYTEDQFEQDMEATTVPEIQRSNLFNIVLQLKAVGIDDLVHFDFMDPPPLETLVGALQKLRYLEALDDEGNLTSIGRKLAYLPIDPSQGKTLLSAMSLGCVAPVLTIVSMLAVQKKGIWYRPRDQMELADAKKRSFHQPEGDQLTLMAVYDGWIESSRSEDWAKSNFVKHRLLMEAYDTRQQLGDMLTKRGAKPVEDFAARDVNAIRKALTAGYFFHAAKRTNLDLYVTMSDRREVAMHPSSCLRELLPKYVIYDELHMTSREYMREVMAIEPAWLVELAPSYYTKPQPGKLTREQMSERLMPTLRGWETGTSWRISNLRRKKK